MHTIFQGQVDIYPTACLHQECPRTDNIILYELCGSRNVRQFEHRVTVFSRQIANVSAGPVLASESFGAKRYFRCNSLNIALKYK